MRNKEENAKENELEIQREGDIAMAEAFIIWTPITGEKKTTGRLSTRESEKFSSSHSLSFYPLSSEKMISELNLEYICFPEGADNSPAAEYTLRHVSITSCTGVKKFATCLNILKGVHRGKALCLISKLPLFDFYERWIVESYYCFLHHQGQKFRNSHYSMEFLIFKYQY